MARTRRETLTEQLTRQGLFRLQANIPRKVHAAISIICIKEERNIHELVTSILESYLREYRDVADRQIEENKLKR